ncbi:MAG: glutamine-hydrolyzing GMP synthase [Deltaproteobacteria bacterium]|jgi:GMP synthase (glutamine-hydrolysing)|nr:glutamine-hydrolyzing GMP synthase [Deltaproteobacteria bacterium]
MAGHVLIIDYGSQFTQLIARKTRALGYYAEILPAGLSLSEPLYEKPGAIVLSGGPASVSDKGAPTLDPLILETGLPILGICYGMQLLAQNLGGRLSQEAHGEYGPADFYPLGSSPLWEAFRGAKSTKVLMSHGDRVEELPEGFEITGKTRDLPIAAMSQENKKIHALQFHPEVHHTEHGDKILECFYKDAGLSPNWRMSSFAVEAVEQISRTVGPDKKVLCGLSGGVDSTVAAALLARAIGDRLYCVFVDNGLLRLNEVDEVATALNEVYPFMNLIVVDASTMFLKRLKDVSDPETKRKIIGHTFIEVFSQEAKKLGKVDFLAQGTLYPDVIESISPQGPSALIKSHHNVGGLPKELNFTLIEPLKYLFKDEVRSLGATLSIPDSLLWRHPFPGPGLAIRIIGPVDEESLDLLRQADSIVQQELKNFALDREIWQAFAVLLPVHSVGVMGDGRSYGKVVAIRAVTSVDAMTADWARLPDELLARFSSRIINEVNGVNRVLYDISSKPPSTIEWE